ncbi:acyl carrier protein [Krasilnikovia sp. M28-CT-15]|uniref:acyl carrier protein n=1 Tax=Krasilnikovia sp. M28-CT-15 TaxID=3373540 RepID=UPI003876E1E5
MTDIIEFIVFTMVDRLEVPAEKIDPTAEFETMELDSLVLVQLAVVLEKEYGVSVEDSEIAAVKTIEQTAALVESKRALV